MTGPKHLFWSVIVSAVAFTSGRAPLAQVPDASAPLVSAAQYERWQTELSNWARPT